MRGERFLFGEAGLLQRDFIQWTSNALLPRPTGAVTNMRGAAFGSKSQSSRRANSESRPPKGTSPVSENQILIKEGFGGAGRCERCQTRRWRCSAAGRKVLFGAVAQRVKGGPEISSPLAIGRISAEYHSFNRSIVSGGTRIFVFQPITYSPWI